METLINLFGQGEELTIYQMSARAFVIYFIALAWIRISGRRTFGGKSAFDNTITIILGAVLSRAVVGASPFMATIVCSLILVLIHRILAWLCIYSETLGHLLKGDSIPLYQNGKINEQNLKTSLLSEQDLIADLRLKANINSLANAEEIMMETTGEVSVVKKT